MLRGGDRDGRRGGRSIVASMTRRPRSGLQLELRHDELRAVVTDVGASLRAFSAGGRDLVVPFGADEVRPAYRGTTLVPWPNRVVDGRFAFGGVERQLPLTEPERGHALHGFGSWLAWPVVEHDASRVVLGLQIEPSLGYPWRIGVETTFSLGAHGLEQQVRATNLGDDAAPWGTGPHPYLRAGDAPLDEWTLSLPASTVLLVTDDRLAPTGLAPVERDAERFDFREPRAIGHVEIDHAYTDVERDDDGFARVRVTDPGSGEGVEMAWDASCPWVQIHTADLPAGPSHPGHRAGLAVEPMTCAPDALNDERYAFDTGLVVLEPGGTHAASWSIAPVRA